MDFVYVSIISFLIGFGIGTYTGYFLQPKTIIQNITTQQDMKIHNEMRQIQQVETYINTEKMIEITRTNYFTNFTTVSNFLTNYTITNK